MNEKNERVVLRGKGLLKGLIFEEKPFFDSSSFLVIFFILNNVATWTCRILEREIVRCISYSLCMFVTTTCLLFKVVCSEPLVLVLFYVINYLFG